MILIIDDDSAVRSSLSFMLKRAGYEVKTAPGPREAMDIVRAEAPALILMDMNFTIEAGKGVPSRCARYFDDGMGKYPACRAGYAGRRIRFHNQALEQCCSFAAHRDGP